MNLSYWVSSATCSRRESEAGTARLYVSFLNIYYHCYFIEEVIAIIMGFVTVCMILISISTIQDLPRISVRFGTVLDTYHTTITEADNKTHNYDYFTIQLHDTDDRIQGVLSAS
ncbi:MAG: hypothetical protein IJL32_15465 [Oscillospiraceae bacterium]|nr:hypothetical protein [Oscillospiraceae bacterium]